jgi:hypothetical protein
MRMDARGVIVPLLGAYVFLLISPARSGAG